MSEIKHPIGSWEIVKTTHGHGVYEKGWGFVATHDKSCHAHWNEGQSARRALIAAAPELLEALQAVLKDEEWHAAMADEVTPKARDNIRKARAAIAKAIGSQS